MKIYGYLSPLSDQEWNELFQYISLETKPQSDIREIADFILFNRRKLLSAEDIQKALFPKLSIKAVSNKVTILKSHVEFFFVWKQLKEKESLSNLLKYEALLKREHFSEVKRIRKKLIKKVRNKSTYDLNSFQAITQIYHLGFYSNDEQKTIEGLTLLQKSYNEHKTELELRFKQYQIEEAVRKKRTNDQHDLIDTEQPSKDHPLSNILDAVLKLVQSKEQKDDLQLVLDYLHAHSQKNVGEIYVFILLHTINVMISNIQTEKSFDTSELIKLYDIGLKNKSFILRGNISARRFGNIINAGFAMKNVDWMDAVIKKYANNLSKDFKDEVTLMSNIQVAIAKKEYQQAWHLFPPRGWNLFDHKYRSKWLMAICMYKLDEFQILESHLIAFKSYANEKKAISPRLRKGIHNFIKLMRMLMKGKSQERIKRAFYSMETVSAGSWWSKELNRDYPSKENPEE